MGTDQTDLTSSSGDGDEGRDRAFDKVWRGFAPDQVSQHLDRVAASVISLEARLRKTNSELMDTRRERDRVKAALVASANRDPFEGVSQHLTQLVRSFDEQVDGLRRDAEAQAGDILTEVRTEGESILTHARAEAERTIEEASTEADRMREQARAEAESIRAEAKMQEEQAQSRAGHLVGQAQRESERVEANLAALKESTLEDFRGIRDRTLAALGELQLVIDRGLSPDDVVIVEDAEEASPTNGSQAFRSDL